MRTEDLPHEAWGVRAVTSPHLIARLSAHNAPEISVIDPRGSRGIGDALEGATGRWVPVAPSVFKELLKVDESSETMICAKCGLPITDGFFVVVERDNGMDKWIEWEHLYDCTDYDTLRFWLNHFNLNF